MRISDWSSDVCSSDLLELERDQRFVLDNQHRGARFAVEIGGRFIQQRLDGRSVGAGADRRFLGRKAFERGQAEELASERGDPPQAAVRGSAERVLVDALPIFPEKNGKGAVREKG